MGRPLLVLIVIALVAPGCMGSDSQPSGKVSVVVTLGAGTNHPATHRYTLRCGPAGGTMPGPGAACGALADYRQHRSGRGRFCTGFMPRDATATLIGRFAGHPLHLQISNGSWCGASDALMRDYWILSMFPCSTLVIRYSDQHPSSKGIAPPRCLRGRA